MTRVIIAAALVTMPAAGCDDLLTAGGVATGTPLFSSLTADDVRELGPDESLAVELDGAYPTVFELDGRGGAIDFGRIIISTADAAPMSLATWLARQGSALDLVWQSGARFRLANDLAAASLGLPEPDTSELRSCDPFDIVELDDVVVVMFDSAC